jgi:tRNA U34 5-methylaminomethyl-2-thiouridine-forming methyltransferase MnmC
MERKIIKTSDGSLSLYLPEWDENYHSKHGAVQEAYHVFIRSGLDLFRDEDKISILEMGFGTGLNCMISFLESKRRDLHIDYTGLEAYPLDRETVLKLNHLQQLKAEKFENFYQKMLEADWDKRTKIENSFFLKKRAIMFEDFDEEQKFNLVYFDAFGARVQPELWTESIFKKMYHALKDNGILVTYSAKGSVRRAMQSVGFVVERLPGPPGKREMLRARKIESQR